MKNLDHIFPMITKNIVLGMRMRLLHLRTKTKGYDIKKQVEQEELQNWSKQK